MKVKLYELLRMLYEGELENGERVIIDNTLYTTDINNKEFYMYYQNGSKGKVFIYVSGLNEECELIDRK